MFFYFYLIFVIFFFFFFSSRRRHTRWNCDWSSDVCSSDLFAGGRHPSGTDPPGADVSLPPQAATSERSAIAPTHVKEAWPTRVGMNTRPRRALVFPPPT